MTGAFQVNFLYILATAGPGQHNVRISVPVIPSYGVFLTIMFAETVHIS
jgi:hypothetical protein